MVQNPFNGIESEDDIRSCMVAFIDEESIQWNWKGLLLFVDATFYNGVRNPFNGIESVAFLLVALKALNLARIHSMELKVSAVLSSLSPSTPFNWIHSMELKVTLAVSGGISLNVIMNPFNGIESICLGIPTSLWYASPGIHSMELKV